MLKIAWNEHYVLPLPDGHRFPMSKYNLIPEQLLYEGTITTANIFSPQPVSLKTLLEVHDLRYWDKLKSGLLTQDEIRRIGFPYSAELIQRELVILQGTIDCAKYAMEHGIALNVAGGTHHAYSNRGEGFCLLNDIAVAATWLLNTGLYRQILIVDLDVHQGNGTAHIFQGNQQVYTFSMHGEKNYPLKKERSDLDVHLADGIDDASYLAALIHHLPKLIDTITPDFVFFQSGVDVLETDKLGRLGLTRRGCMERDRYVLDTCKKHQIPVVVVMGGGYSERITDIVEAHANTFRLAASMFG